ncbi:MAG: Homeodomain-like domain-containing protein [Verrucomicrobia bacterium]|nr:MAG: Homeodomain-like domain-containing protein [Verrucomicrobiota bacterium]
MVKRCRITLMRVDGVSHWEKRFRNGGVDGRQEGRRSGRKPVISMELKAEIIAEAPRPPAGCTQWSTRKMARAKGVSNHTVHKLWSANDIKPHRKRTFKLSKDPQFEAKFWDVIGLDLNPPERALVLCCDEKSQCQALERTQPGLPLGIGHVHTATHDFIRRGRVALFAALRYLDGAMIRDPAERHTHVQWLGFLKKQIPEWDRGSNGEIIVTRNSTAKIEWSGIFHQHPRLG